jgi:hypothetical protein
MKLIAVAACALFALPTITRADDNDWFGFYRGIDPFDGDVGTLSIVPGEGTDFKVLVAVDEAGACGGGPGYAIGTGKLAGDNLNIVDRVFQCRGKDEPFSIQDSHMFWAGDTEILVLIATAPETREIHFHRLSD